MRRRDLLAAIGTSVALAGCAGGGDDRGSDTGENGTDAAGGETEVLPLAERGIPSTICEETLSPEGIRAIGEPAFGPPAEWPDDPDGYRPLTDERTVIGLEGSETARAYPLTILSVHEIVNDTLGTPVIVTYCPLCRSGMVADRRVNGEPATFDVSGLLWQPPRIRTAASEEEGRVFSDRERGIGNNGNLVMYDDVTGSYWSQLLARAICGPKREERMTIRPSTVASWGEWRQEHPDAEVLLPPPDSTAVDPPVWSP